MGDETNLYRVRLTLCWMCINGHGGECHVPGCALWMSTAPDVSIADKVEHSVLVEEDARG